MCDGAKTLTYRWPPKTSFAVRMCLVRSNIHVEMANFKYYRIIHIWLAVFYRSTLLIVNCRHSALWQTEFLSRSHVVIFGWNARKYRIDAIILSSLVFTLYIVYMHWINKRNVLIPNTHQTPTWHQFVSKHSELMAETNGETHVYLFNFCHIYDGICAPIQRQQPIFTGIDIILQFDIWKNIFHQFRDVLVRDVFHFVAHSRR